MNKKTPHITLEHRSVKTKDTEWRWEFGYPLHGDNDPAYMVKKCLADYEHFSHLYQGSLEYKIGFREH